MQTQLRSPVARAFARGPADTMPPAPTLLDLVGPVAGEHVVIIGARCLDLMCALIGRGAAEATLLPRGERPEPHAADLAILVHVHTADEANAAIAHARRALTDAGRIVLATGPDPLGLLAAAIARCLCAAGFSSVTARGTGESSVLTGELPLFGGLAHRRCASF